MGCVCFFRHIGACTLAVTTVHSVPQGYLPAEIRDKAPFPRSGTARWWDVWADADFVLWECVSMGWGGMVWISEFA